MFVQILLHFLLKNMMLTENGSFAGIVDLKVDLADLEFSTDSAVDLHINVEVEFDDQAVELNGVYNADFDVNNIGGVLFSEYETGAAAVNGTKASNKVSNIQILTLDGVLILLQQSMEAEQIREGNLARIRVHKGKRMKSQILDLVNSGSTMICMIVFVVIANMGNSIEIRMIEHSLYYIKIKRINFDLWPL